MHPFNKFNQWFKYCKFNVEILYIWSYIPVNPIWNIIKKLCL